jgi:hypothetical protein
LLNDLDESPLSVRRTSRAALSAITPRYLVSERPTWLNVTFCQVGMEADCLHLSRNPLDEDGVGARVAEEYLRRYGHVTRLTCWARSGFSIPRRSSSSPSPSDRAARCRNLLRL